MDKGIAQRSLLCTTPAACRSRGAVRCNRCNRRGCDAWATQARPGGDGDTDRKGRGGGIAQSDRARWIYPLDVLCRMAMSSPVLGDPLHLSAGCERWPVGQRSFSVRKGGVGCMVGMDEPGCRFLRVSASCIPRVGFAPECTCTRRCVQKHPDVTGSGVCGQRSMFHSPFPRSSKSSPCRSVS